MSLRTPDIKIHTHPLSLIQDPERIKSLQRGEIIHRALFYLEHHSGDKDIERAVRQAFSFLGFERDRWDLDSEYLKPLAIALSLPEVRPWFARGVTCLREAEVVDAQGALHRIDRLVIGDTVHEVIDFKVGSREAEHQLQVELYQRLVEDVFNRATTGYILYVDEPAVVATP